MHQISDVEFPEMGANIQCNSYFPGYHWTRNHNLIANSSKRKHNLSPGQFLGYYKEVLKQTMLEQEMILRDQIQDLHHLYGRQRELMVDIRRNELVKHQLKMEASHLTAALSQSSSFCVQKTFHLPSLHLANPVYNQIFVSGAESIQSPSCFVRGRNIQACSYSTQTEGRSGDTELLESKCKRFQNFLDLECLADAYIDNEEEELLGNGKIFEAPKASCSQALPCFNTPIPFSNSYKLSTVKPGLNGDRLQLKKDLRSSTIHSSAFFLDNGFSNGSQLESKSSEAHPPPHISFDNLIRINDNVVSEYHGIKKYMQGSANVKSPKDINLNFMPPSCPLDVAVFQSFQATIGSEKLEDYNEQLHWHRPKLVYNRKTYKGRDDSNQAEASDHSSERIRGSGASCEKLNISCDGCSHGSPSNANLNPPEEKKKRKKFVVLDLNLVCDSVLDTETEITEYVVENEFDKKDVGFGLQIDLNSSINEDEFSPMPALSTEIVLKVPASPENKECSPPRGESDQNQVETPFLLSGQEDLENTKECFVPIGESDENQIETHFPSSGDSGQKVDLEEELVRTAAESLASISSSGLHTCIVRTMDKLLKTSCDSLHWFAGIASAVVGGPENKPGVVMSEDLLPDGMDYFEVMTLNLTETKVEEFCCKSIGHKEEETGTTSSPSQPRKGRKRRGRQRKDFQSEILPSLAALSRYEVTEDLQTLGELVETSGNHLKTGSARYAAKLGLAKGRRRSGTSTPNVTENTLESLLKQIGSKSQFGKEERMLIGWGEVTRRRRGQRFPVSKPRLILSQV